MVGFTQSLGLIGHMWRRLFAQCETSELQFETASNNLVGLLTVGEVIGGSGVNITDYVIEWRLGSITGEIILITGIGDDPAIQAFHPIISEPVVGGELYAVIRYIVIDGVRYSPYFRQGQYSPDLLECLGSVTIVTMNCGNGTIGTYSHQVEYMNTSQPASNATRTLKFDLNSDGSTTEFAWRFYTLTIADRIQIYYVSGETETLLRDWVVGLNVPANDFVNTPHKYNQTTLLNVIDLTTITYVSGDWLKIVITPSYYDPSFTDTNWYVYFKCFDSTNPFNRLPVPNITNDIDLESFAMTWDAVRCGWSLTFDTGDDSTAALTTSDVYQYLHVIGYYSWDWALQREVFLDQNSGCNSSFGYTYFTGTIVALDGELTIAKVGSNLSYSFTNEDDYNLYKTQYEASIASAHYADYSADGTNLLHYKMFYILERISMTGGDTAYNKYIYLSPHCTFTFDDVNYIISIDVVPQVNEFVSPACDTTGDTLDAWNANMDNTFNENNYSITTKYRADYQFTYIYYIPYTFNQTDKTWGTWFTLVGDLFDNAFSTMPAEWWNQGAGYYGWTFTKFYLRVIITDNDDPANNFQVWSKLNADGSHAANWTLIYEVP